VTCAHANDNGCCDSPVVSRRVDGRELFVCPFFADGAQPDAHNGGGLVVGGDGKLYVSFGDGWREEAATDLRGFAGKIVRLNRDGSIPQDNMWYDVLEGDLRAIVAVGQRNPTCLSRHPVSGEIYINGFTGEAKAGMFRLVQGAHYGHGGSCELGERVPEWINTRMANGGTTWACWYPAGGTWPEEFWNNALAVNWMPNSGEIVRIRGSEQQPEKTSFARGLVYLGGDGVMIGPVAAEIGPDGHLYYTVREYGEYTDLRRIRRLDVGEDDQAVASRSPPVSSAVGEDPAISLKDLMRDERDWLSAVLVDGDAQRGRRIFFENDGLACLKCHRWGESGGEVGPPLTDIGARRSRKQILESILSPNREIEEAYVQEIIATEDGQIVTGRIVDDASDHLVVLTADNRRVSVPKSSIQARRPGPSAMPDDFARRLTPRELRDLVEFLARKLP
jgi:putative heme-binding domain-containing protein